MKGRRVLFYSSLLAQIVAFLTLVGIARSYSAAEVGQYAVSAAVAGILALVPSLRYEQVMLSGSREGSFSHARDTVYLSILVTVVLLGLILITRNFLPDSIQSNLLLIVYIAFASSNYQTFFTLLTRNACFRGQGLGIITQQLVFALFALYLNDVVEQSLIASFAIAQTAALCVIFTAALRTKKELIIDYRCDFKFFSRNFEFPKSLLPGSLLNAVSNHTPVIIVEAFAGQALAGHFSVAQKILQLPMYIFGNPIGTAFAGNYSSTQDPVLRKRLVQKVTRTLLELILFPLICFAFFGSEIVGLIFGLDWKESAEIAIQLLPMALFWFLVSPLSVVMIINRLPRTDLFFQTLLFITRVLGLTVLYLLDLPNLFLAYGILIAVACLLYLSKIFSTHGSSFNSLCFSSRYFKFLMVFGSVSLVSLSIDELSSSLEVKLLLLSLFGLIYLKSYLLPSFKN